MATLRARTDAVVVHASDRLQCCAGVDRRRQRLPLGRLVPADPAPASRRLAAGRPGRCGLCRDHVHLLLVAQSETSQQCPVAFPAPVPPQPGAHRGNHEFLQEPARDHYQWSLVECDPVRTVRALPCRRRPYRDPHGARRIRLPHEHKDTARDGSVIPATRDASHPPCTRPASLQLRRSAVMGHAVRHVSQPCVRRQRDRLPGQNETRVLDLLCGREMAS